jgi:hypothetical protein
MLLVNGKLLKKHRCSLRMVFTEKAYLPICFFYYVVSYMVALSLYIFKDTQNISNKLQKMGANYFNGVKIRTAMRSAVITGPGGEIGRHKRLKISRS